MTKDAWDSAHISELPTRGRRRAVRERFGIEAFGVNAFTTDSGADVISPHTEVSHEELYVVVSGRARFTVDGEEVEAPQGTIVFVRNPAATRGATAEEPDTTVLAEGAPRGAAFTVSDWEGASEFWPLYQAKDYDAAVAALERALEQRPDSSSILYNLACCEALAGRREDALAHLQGSLELDPSIGEFAGQDDDFASIKDDPEFQRATQDAQARTAERSTASTDGKPAYATAHLSEVRTQRGAEDSTWIRIRRHLDVGGFGINAYRADEQDGRVIEDHTEGGAAAGRHEELYFVANGKARFTVGGEEFEAPTGTFVFVREPQTRRGATADEPGTTVLVVGGKRGEPYEVSPWEEWAEAWPHYEAKEYDKAIEVFQRGLEKYPDNASALYNLACVEALTGRSDDALQHLARACEQDERMREYATSDTDLDSIRDDPRFEAAAAGRGLEPVRS